MIFIMEHRTAAFHQATRIRPRSVILFLLTLITITIPLACGKKEAPPKEQPAETEKRTAVAVLDFQNLAADKNTDWIGKGIAQLLIAQLSQSPQLAVARAARIETIFRIMEIQETADLSASVFNQVARNAEAEKAVMGSYRFDGHILTVTARLVDTATGRVQAESSTEGQGLESLFADSEMIVGFVRKELGVPAGPGDTTLLVTKNIEALRHFVRSQEALAKFNSSQAMTDLNRSVDQDTSFALAYAAMAIHTYSIGDNPRATWAVGRALRDLDRLPQPEKLMVQAIDAQLTGKVDEAFQYFKRLQELVALDPETYLVLAQLYYAIRDYPSAERIYQNILQQDPKNVTAHIMLALAQLELNLTDLAQSEAEKAIGLRPDNPYAYIVMSRIYIYQGREKDAELQLHKASELNPEDPWIHNLLGYFYLNYHKTDLALKEFKRYAELAPDDPNAHDSLAEGYLRAGNKEMAEKEYLYALKLKPDFANPHYMLGLLYNEKGETQKAIGMFQKYLRISPYGPLAEAAEKKLEELSGQ